MTEVTFLEARIQSLMREIEGDFFEYFVAYQHYDIPNKYDTIEKEDQYTWIYQRLRQLYNTILVYLENKQLHHYASIFKKEFSAIILDKKAALKSHGGLYNDSDPSLIIIDEFSVFLSPFIAFNTVPFSDNRVSILEEVLVNTGRILKKTKIVIKNETSIYNTVKWFLELVFPKIRNGEKARFIRKFKTYHPDILIPEIKVAIEYKYIRKGDNYENYIDEVKTDADNYIKDPEYQLFYAVIYIEDSLEASKKAIFNAWEEKGFPKNWHLIIPD